MGKELNLASEIVGDDLETQSDSQIIKLDELALAYIGGGEQIVLM
jgi:hypothetical protein